MSGFAPERDGFLNEPCFRVMLGEELGLGLGQLRGNSFESFGDLRV